MNDETNPPTGILDSSGHRAREIANKGRAGCDHAMERANECIRENPMPSVAAAFAFGIAVGCLIMSGTHRSWSERYVEEPTEQAVDSLYESLGRLYATLKFW